MDLWSLLTGGRYKVRLFIHIVKISPQARGRDDVWELCGCLIKKDTFKFAQVTFPSMRNFFNIIQIHKTQWQRNLTNKT